MAPRKKADAPAKPKAKAAPKAKVAAKSKLAAKKPAPAKPKSKVPARRPTPEPEEPAKRRKVHLETDSSTPKWDKKVTSRSKRPNGTFKLTRASLYDNSIDSKSVDELAEQLNPYSSSRTTWGASVEAPIPATTGTKGKSIMKRPKRQTAADPTQSFLAMMEDMKRGSRKIIPNTPKRSRFLRLSLEIRERVYAHLLKYPSAILVKPDWQTVETNAFVNHSICRVCKQIHNECTTYLYKENVIQAVFRQNTRAFKYYHEPTLIASHFVPYYKHVVLDFNSECWSLNWYEKATESLKVLIAAKTALKTLTLVVAPKRVGMSTTALGTESNPVTFADFLWYDGEFMKALRELAPRVFKIIFKKGLTKKLTMSVDMRYLNASSPQEPHLVNSFTWKMLLAKEGMLCHELRGLRKTFDEIYEDDALVVKKGKCTTNEPLPEPKLQLSFPSMAAAQGVPENLEEMEMESMELDTEGLVVDVVERFVKKEPEEDHINLEDEFNESGDSKVSANLWNEEIRDEKLTADDIEESFVKDDPDAICTDIGENLDESEDLSDDEAWPGSKAYEDENDES